MKIISFIKKFMVICFATYCSLTTAMSNYDHNDSTVKKVTAYVRKYINSSMPVIEDKRQLIHKQQQSLYQWVEGKEFKDISGQQVYTVRRSRFDTGGVNDRESREYLVRK